MTIQIEGNSAAGVFKEDGTIETALPSFPDDAEVPPYVLICLGVMMLLHEDEDIQDRVKAKIEKLLEKAGGHT